MKLKTLITICASYDDEMVMGGVPPGFAAHTAHTTRRANGDVVCPFNLRGQRLVPTEGTFVFYKVISALAAEIIGVTPAVSNTAAKKLAAQWLRRVSSPAAVVAAAEILSGVLAAPLKKQCFSSRQHGGDLYYALKGWDLPCPINKATPGRLRNEIFWLVKGAIL